jgi:modification methylase
MVLAAGAAAGLIPAGRCVALLAGLRGGQIIARPSFFQMENVRKARRKGEPWHLIVHEDVLIFTNPLFPGKPEDSQPVTGRALAGTGSPGSGPLTAWPA